MKNNSTLQLLKDIYEGVETLFDTLAEAVKDIVTSVAAAIAKKKEVEKHEYNWKVPQDTTKKSQVTDKKPVVSHTKNDI